MLPKTPRATGQIRSTNGYSPRRDGATVRRGASLRALAGCGRTSHGALTSWKLALHPDLYFGELYMDGALILERGTLWDLLELLGRNLAEKGLTGQLRHFADCSAAVAAKQFPPRGQAPCRTPLRPLPSALSAVSRHRPAVLLRLFRRRPLPVVSETRTPARIPLRERLEKCFGILFGCTRMPRLDGAIAAENYRYVRKADPGRGIDRRLGASGHCCMWGHTDRNGRQRDWATLDHREVW
jgi:hypothetical protein